MIKFYRGNRDFYSNTSHSEGIYFAQDTGEIIVNGIPYGASLYKDENGDIKVHYSTYVTTEVDGEEVVTREIQKDKDFREFIGDVTEEQSGLMSSAMLEKLNALDEDAIGVLLDTENEKILQLDPVTGVLSASVKFNTELVSKGGASYLQLVNNDGDVISEFDVSSFIKDGFLKSVELVNASTEVPIGDATSGKFIKFTWNADGILDPDDEDSDPDVMYVAISDFVATYQAGDGISITTENGVEVISINEVKASKVKIAGDDANAVIKIAGGPLATDAVKSAFPNGISSSTDLYSLLRTLFLKEDWQKYSYNAGSSIANIDAPSFSIKVGDNVVSRVEVGTDVTVTSVTAPAVSPDYTARKVSFTYGYSAANDNSKDDNGPVTATASNNNVNSGTYTLTRTYKTFKNTSGNTPALDSYSNAANTSTILSEATVRAQEGTNKVTVSVTGPTTSVTFGTLSDMYACSNLGNTKTDEGYKFNAVASETVKSLAASNSAEATVEGVRYMFWGAYPEHQNTITSDVIRGLAALSSGGSCEASATTKDIKMTSEGVKHFIVAVPSAYKLSAAKNKTAMDNDEAATKFTESSVYVEGANGYTSTQYKVYSFKSDTAWLGTTSAYTIIISKV